MALDKEFFDAINIDVVKKKYYNANKVNALLENIRSQAEALEAENRMLKSQFSDISQRKDEIGDTLLTAQSTARDIVGRAREQAVRIVADAQRQREEILSGAADQQEYAAACVERAFDRLKRQQMENVEMLNGMWQEFLCGLMTEDAGEEGPEAPVEAAEPAADMIRTDELEAMVSTIARELFEINGEE